MIDILIIEDDSEKRDIISASITEINPHFADKIVVTSNIIGAKVLMELTKFDIVIVDLVVPLREGDEPNAKHCIEFVRELDYTPFLKPPLFLIGITAYPELLDEHSLVFEERLSYLLEYDYASDAWKSRLKRLVYNFSKFEESLNNHDEIQYKYDAAIITALYDPEFLAVKSLTSNWKKITPPGDPAIYYEAVIQSENSSKKIIVSFCDQMGMVATSTLATKIMLKFRPQYVFLTGITAAVKKKGVNYGDILIADVCWDYNSGKISEFKVQTKLKDQRFSKIRFEPEPKSIPIYTTLKNKLTEFSTNTNVLSEIAANWSGAKYRNELRAYIGPLASGSQVVASTRRLNEIKGQNRKLIGIEMEAYGLFYACSQFSENKIIPIVVKSVCDFGDLRKGDKHQKYAAYTSAQFAFKFLEQCL